MESTTGCRSPAASPRWLLAVASVGVGLYFCWPRVATAVAPPAFVDPLERSDDASGIHVLDGSYVMNVGELQVNITNHGLIGSQYTLLSTFSSAPSAQWPGGSGVEYLWSAGLWVGGLVSAQPRVSTGQYERELRPRDGPLETIYEAREGRVLRPVADPVRRGKRIPQAGYDDDGDGFINEETLDGHDNDGDGLVDEDFAQIGDQMLVCTMYDNTPLAAEIYPDHQPLNVRVVQSSYAWVDDGIDDAVGFDFDVTNIGADRIEAAYLGFFVDGDVGSRSYGGGGSDDLYGWFDGFVQSRRGAWVRVTVFYFRDGDVPEPAPGWFGVMFLDHTVEPTSARYPEHAAVHGFQAFAGAANYQQGGIPTNDGERYALMARSRWDPPAVSGQESDWSVLFSVGPFKILDPGRTVRLSLAMVAGNGLDGLLSNCAEVSFAYIGQGYDMDDSWYTNLGGEETKICLEDVTVDPRAMFQPLFQVLAMFGDDSCLPPIDPEAPLFIFPISPELLWLDEYGKHCIHVNMDNCAECERLAGRSCTKENGLLLEYNCAWSRSDPHWNDVCTGIAGRETHLRWALGRVPPPPPSLRLMSDHNAVHVFWDDRSEHEPDPNSGLIDFESYRVWRADDWDRPWGSSAENGPASELWRMIAEYDLDDTYVRYLPAGEFMRADTLALGANTGLEVVSYVPVCLADARFAGLAEAMLQVVTADSSGRWPVRPPLRDARGVVTPGLEPLLPWESWPAALDTFFMVTARAADPLRGVPAKRATGYYEYVDPEVHNGFLYFYSVIATDRSMEEVDGRWVCTGPGLVDDPRSSFQLIAPGTTARSAADVARQGLNCFVYPNPATREALDEFQRLGPSEDDPTGVRVMFANLPRARNRIKIFTLDGDLVQEIEHDGTTGHGEASWNLVSRNGQQVVSGIYLYAVLPDDRRFQPFKGKFVVIR